MCKKLIVIGAGGHGRVVADTAAEAGFELLGFLDDSAVGENILGGLGLVGEYASETSFIIAVGDNGARKRIAERLYESFGKISYATVIHPRATVSKSAVLGEGSVVMAGAVINAGARVGAHCIINTSSVVEHDCRLCDFVHISPRAALSGTVSVGECTHIGTGVSVRNNVSIAENTVVGVGAAVVKNIDASGVYCGVPARKLIK